MSWIFLRIANNEDIINKKSINNYRYGQCQRIVLIRYYVGFALHDCFIHTIVSILEVSTSAVLNAISTNKQKISFQFPGSAAKLCTIHHLNHNFDFWTT
ncbi:hypothetical protein VNO77_00752 [Canavalia gladiata]|uniref:Uncharacterized protein n=1 Tax=Canavalia gladiata TaxID=3824 RepID=A0AAN9MUS7_CANGL